jgi:hypothetical protein
MDTYIKKNDRCHPLGFPDHSNSYGSFISEGRKYFLRREDRHKPSSFRSQGSSKPKPFQKLPTYQFAPFCPTCKSVSLDDDVYWIDEMCGGPSNMRMLQAKPIMTTEDDQPLEDQIRACHCICSPIATHNARYRLKACCGQAIAETNLQKRLSSVNDTTITCPV